MSNVMAVPAMMASAAADLATVGSDLSAAQLAATPTVTLVPAAADEVSAGIAHLFSRYAEDFQGLAGRAAVFHDQFTQHLSAGAGSYASAEAVNVSYLMWLAQNAGLGVALGELIREVGGNSRIFQLIGDVLAPIAGVVGISAFLLVLIAAWIGDLLTTFLGQLGL